MAPAEPLLNAAIAATRRNLAGEVVAPNERLDVGTALRAVTVDAARMLDEEHEVGTLAAGKRADMTVVDGDPFEVGAEGLGALRVLATVFGGRVFET